MKIVFLLTNIPNPRINKRIKAFSEFAEVHVVCFRRTNMDVYPLVRISGVQYHIRDMVIPSMKHVVKRLMALVNYLRFSKICLKQIRPNLVYLCGLDNLLVASISISREAKICYEVADLRESYTNRDKLSLRGLFDSTIRMLEKCLSRKVSFLTVTSIKFYDTYYYKLFSRNQVIEVPNMPNLEAFRDYKPKHGGEFTIGFVGAIRYIEQMKMLVDAAEEADIKVIFSGASLDKGNALLAYCKDKPWVRFTGRYDFMKDIADIYSRLDCVYSVYDAANFNVRIALPNKLYEAVVAELPIIVANNTYLGELVTEWGTGVTVDYDNKAELVDILKRLKQKDGYYQQMVENCRCKKADINVSMYLDQLCERIKKL